MDEVQIYQLKDRELDGGGVYRYAENMNGEYIGDPATARMLLEKFDIRPEAIPGHNVCSIGFSPRDQKWYGWSHRALYGFGVGSEVKKGDCAYVGATPEDLIEARAEFFSDISEESADLHRRECQILEDRSGIRILHAPMVIPMANSIEDALDDDAVLEQVDIAADAVSVEPCGRGEWKAETLDDAKQMATDFANGVG